jgi:xanthine dehydrogenase accessory factor
VKNIYSHILDRQENNEFLALATILDTKGSVPQVQGASALFSREGLIAGTLGGGILEAEAARRASEAIRKGSTNIYEFDLNADISSKEAAICGGSASILIDTGLDDYTEVFNEMVKSVQHGRPGVLVTTISEKEAKTIKRQWVQEASGEYLKEISLCLDERKCLYMESSEGTARFFEPVLPLPKLIIAGAGHIGKAVAHLANLLDFEVTVADDRPEYANPQNIPEADHLIVDDIGKAVQAAVKSPDTYVVIVTRGHKDDAEALKACLDSDVAYIGMIGSKRKIRLMREEFISKGWASESGFDRVYAPIGLEIGSKTIQEIAVSICAQLIQVRHRRLHQRKTPSITAIILGAGESSRMGRPKLLLPFGESTVIGTVIQNALSSTVENIIVVLGSNYESHRVAIKETPVEIIRNRRYKDGMLSSVQCGLGAIPETTDAVMVLLGDQPMIEGSEMNKLIESFSDSGKEIIIATHRDKRGHPILFGRKYIDEIKGYAREASLRDLLQKHPEAIREIEAEDSGILRDIDTDEDYREELKHKNKHD